MSEICAGLGAGSTHPQVRTFWNLAAAMFEAQHHGLLGFDVFTKRVASRLLAQFRLLQRGDSDVSERLARDILFFCAQAAPAGRGVSVPRLARRARGLRLRRAGADRLLAQRPRPLRPGDRRARARSASPPRRRPGRRPPAARCTASPASRSSSRSSAIRCGACSRSARRSPPSCRRPSQQTQAAQARAAGAAGDGGRDQPALSRGRARGRRLRPARARRAHQAPRRAARRGAPEAAARAARAVDGGALPARLRSPDDGQRRPGAARLAAPRSRSRSTSSSATRPTARCCTTCRSSSRSMRGVLSVLGMDAASQALLRMRDEVDGLVSTQVDPEQDRGRPASSSASPATCRRSAS